MFDWGETIALRAGRRIGGAVRSIATRIAQKFGISRFNPPLAPANIVPSWGWSPLINTLISLGRRLGQRDAA